MIHVIPLTAAIVLLVLNLSRFYVGVTFNSQALVALQFAAKLHEIFMVASLSSAFFSYMSYSLTSETGLPFGAAFAGLQVTHISYLWSLELWGALTSHSFPLKLKLRLALATISTAILVAVVGPASASLMVRMFLEFSS